MTLKQRRRRLLIGLAICGIALIVIVTFGPSGVDQSVALISIMPLAIPVSVIAGQLLSIRAKIAAHGPDALEEEKPVSRTALLVGVAAIILAVAIGVVAISASH